MGGWKLPPKAKIYEALTAVADARVKLKGNETAEVVSSDGTKTYIVEWSADLRQITSNDNASYWQRYIGYPIIAVLMVLGRLDFDRRVAQALSGIAWKQMNRKFRNDYEKAVESVLLNLDVEPGLRRTVVSEVDKIFNQLETLDLERLPVVDAHRRAERIPGRRHPVTTVQYEPRRDLPPFSLPIGVIGFLWQAAEPAPYKSFCRKGCGSTRRGANMYLETDSSRYTPMQH